MTICPDAKWLTLETDQVYPAGEYLVWGNRFGSGLHRPAWLSHLGEDTTGYSDALGFSCGGPNKFYRLMYFGNPVSERRWKVYFDKLVVELEHRERDRELCAYWKDEYKDLLASFSSVNPSAAQHKMAQVLSALMEARNSERNQETEVLLVLEYLVGRSKLEPYYSTLIPPSTDGTVTGGIISNKPKKFY